MYYGKGNWLMVMVVSRRNTTRDALRVLCVLCNILNTAWPEPQAKCFDLLTKCISLPFVRSYLRRRLRLMSPVTVQAHDA